MSFRRIIAVLTSVAAGSVTSIALAAQPAQAAVPSDWRLTAQYSVSWRNVNQLQETFARATDGSLTHIYQTHINGPSTTGSLGGDIKGSPAVTFNTNDQTHVFVRGTNNQIWVRWQLYAGSTDAYSDPWYQLFNVPGGAISNPSAVIDERGFMEVFVTGADESIYTMWQTVAGGSWAGGDWTSIGGICISSPKAVLVGTRMKVFCYGDDGDRYVNIRNNAYGAGWSGWNPG